MVGTMASHSNYCGLAFLREIVPDLSCCFNSIEVRHIKVHEDQGVAHASLMSSLDAPEGFLAIKAVVNLPLVDAKLRQH